MWRYEIMPLSPILARSIPEGQQAGTGTYSHTFSEFSTKSVLTQFSLDSETLIDYDAGTFRHTQKCCGCQQAAILRG